MNTIILSHRFPVVSCIQWVDMAKLKSDPFGQGYALVRNSHYELKLVSCHWRHSILNFLLRTEVLLLTRGWSIGRPIKVASYEGSAKFDTKCVGKPESLPGYCSLARSTVIRT